MKFKATHNYILVKSAPPITKIGMFDIPENSLEKHLQGKAISVGPGLYNEIGTLIPMAVKVGDNILFSKTSGTEIKIDGETYLILKENDVIGIIEE